MTGPTGEFRCETCGKPCIAAPNVVLEWRCFAHASDEEKKRRRDWLSREKTS
jgi:hypothetical protein